MTLMSASSEVEAILPTGQREPLTSLQEQTAVPPVNMAPDDPILTSLGSNVMPNG